MAISQAYTDSEVFEIAKRQKDIIWLILIYLPTCVLALKFPALGFIILIIALLSILSTYKLAAALKERAPWLYIIFTLLPCLNLFVLLALSMRATSVLKAGGIHVGLLGASRVDLDKFLKKVA